jgi:hypothetical protein
VDGLANKAGVLVARGAPPAPSTRQFQRSAPPVPPPAKRRKYKPPGGGPAGAAFPRRRPVGRAPSRWHPSPKFSPQSLPALAVNRPAKPPGGGPAGHSPSSMCVWLAGRLTWGLGGGGGGGGSVAHCAGCWPSKVAGAGCRRARRAPCLEIAGSGSTVLVATTSNQH